MSIYYIETKDNVVYHLDATTDISKTMSGKITDNPVESNETLTDHYVHNPDSFNFSGTITDIKSLSSDGKSTKEYIEGLTKVKENGEAFTLYFGGKVGASVNCMFTMLQIKQTKRNGHVGSATGGVDSFKIQASIKKVKVAAQAEITVQRDEEFENRFGTEAQSAKTTAEANIEELTGKERAIARAAEQRRIFLDLQLRPPTGG